MRALAIGGGKAEGEEDTVLAQLVNDDLQRIDFKEMAAEDGVIRILKILAGSKENGAPSNPLLPSGCEIEAACLGQFRSGVMQRLKLSKIAIGN